MSDRANAVRQFFDAAAKDPSLIKARSAGWLQGRGTGARQHDPLHTTRRLLGLIVCEGWAAGGCPGR